MGRRKRKDPAHFKRAPAEKRLRRDDSYTTPTFTDELNDLRDGLSRSTHDIDEANPPRNELSDLRATLGVRNRLSHSTQGETSQHGNELRDLRANLDLRNQLSQDTQDETNPPRKELGDLRPSLDLRNRLFQGKQGKTSLPKNEDATDYTRKEDSIDVEETGMRQDRLSLQPYEPAYRERSVEVTGDMIAEVSIALSGARGDTPPPPKRHRKGKHPHRDKDGGRRSRTRDREVRAKTPPVSDRHPPEVSATSGSHPQPGGSVSVGEPADVVVSKNKPRHDFVPKRPISSFSVPEVRSLLKGDAAKKLRMMLTRPQMKERLDATMEEKSRESITAFLQVFDAAIRISQSDGRPPAEVDRFIKKAVQEQYVMHCDVNAVVQNCVRDVSPQSVDCLTWYMTALNFLAVEEGQFQKLDMQITFLCATVGNLEPSLSNSHFQEALSKLQNLREPARAHDLLVTSALQKDKEMCRELLKKDIFPTTEVLQQTAATRLQPNVISGPYESVGSYLTIHFNLMREDYIQPLMQGISYAQRLLSDEVPHGERCYDARIYLAVEVAGQVFSEDHGVLFSVQLKPTRSQQDSKRLIHGTLILLSDDKFETFVYGTVVQYEQLEGTATIKPPSSANGQAYLWRLLKADTACTMIETKAFFETYYQALKGLKELARGVLNDCPIPFSDTIVLCKATPGLPRYIERFCATHKGLDISCIMKGTRDQGWSQNSLSWLDLTQASWPALSETTLNESQFATFQRIFSHRIALIQGPPGTGKTFIGVKVVQVILNTVYSTTRELRYNKLALLDSRKILRELNISDSEESQDEKTEYDPENPGFSNHSRANRVREGQERKLQADEEKANRAENAANAFGPILLVCYKNHALDQLLSGILAACRPVLNLGDISPDIVRVGSRCKDPELLRFSLQKRRMKFKRAQSFFDNRDMLRDIGQHVNSVARQLNHLRKDIVSSHPLQTSMGDTFHSQIDLPNVKFCNGMVEWLFGNAGFPSDFELARRAKAATENTAEFLGVEKNLEPDNFYDDSDDEVLGEDLAELNSTKPVFDKSFVALHLSTTNMYTSANGVEQLLTYEEMETFAGLFNAAERKYYNTEQNTLELNYDLPSIWRIPSDTRWAYYFRWRDQLSSELKDTKAIMEREYQQLSEELNNIKDRRDMSIMRTSKIIALTTTAAARYMHVLKDITPRVVIIEEAAEILESHTLAALTARTEHVIMIGDHQQLRPSCHVDQLAKECNLTCSMFERLIWNDVPFETLRVQHRMRPEISEIIVPDIYSSLIDHESVKLYPSVKGMENNVFFMSHEEPENDDPDSSSYSNTFEADMVFSLTKYLLQQGYKKSDITVVTPYSGQRAIIAKVMDSINPQRSASQQQFPNFGRNFPYQEQITQHEQEDRVRVCTVDDYQGQENKIIILSLVRSNRSNRIGHVKSDLRICVMLSRAREGMYVVGNCTSMKKASSLWTSILAKVENSGKTGNYFPIQCKNHPDRIQHMTTPEDFQRLASEGGCAQKCGTRKECGHACDRKCHTDDTNHTEICKSPCIKILCDRNHRCPRPCWQPCLRCDVLVDKVVPECQHTQKVECHLPENDIPCKEWVTATLSCGHTKRVFCYKQKALDKVLCEHLVSHNLRCGHSTQAECYKGTPLCLVPCEATLQCGHKCKGTCGKCYSGRVHRECTNKCQKHLMCGHPCPGKCSEPCPSCQMPCQNYCKHNKCPKRCGQLCCRCEEPCKEKVAPDSAKCELHCWEPCDSVREDKPCRRLLKCGHKCCGLQHYRCPTVCRRCDPHHDAFNIFFGSEEGDSAMFLTLECRHTFEVSGLDEWVKTQATADESSAIQMPVCPHCKRTIVNRRYISSKEVKEARLNVEMVKRKMLTAEQQEVQEERARINLSVRCQSSPIRERIHRARTRIELLNSSNCVKLFNALSKQLQATKTTKSQQSGDTFQAVSEEILKMQRLLEKGKLTKVQQADLAVEVRRLGVWWNLEMLEDAHFNEEPPEKLKQDLDNFLKRFRTCTRLPDADLAWAREVVTSLQPLTTGLGISEEEKALILKAFPDGQRGHWFRCPKGHVYYIGECGGATQEGWCNECGASIGGQHHELRSDNALAPEMDGATHAAYSQEANNLANWNLDDLH